MQKFKDSNKKEFLNVKIKGPFKEFRNVGRKRRFSFKISSMSGEVINMACELFI